MCFDLLAKFQAEAVRDRLQISLLTLDEYKRINVIPPEIIRKPMA